MSNQDRIDKILDELEVMRRELGLSCISVSKTHDGCSVFTHRGDNCGIDTSCSGNIESALFDLHRDISIAEEVKDFLRVIK